MKTSENKYDYADVTTPRELLQFMEAEIRYGYVDNEGKAHTPDNPDWL